MENAPSKAIIQRRERFLRVIPKRIDSILKKIQVLSNCASRLSYDYTPQQIDRIFETIEKQLELAKNRFKTGKQEVARLTREELEKLN